MREGSSAGILMTQEIEAIVASNVKSLNLRMAIVLRTHEIRDIIKSQNAEIQQLKGVIAMREGISGSFSG